MNNREKLGYMALGATILAVGIAMGQWATPNIEAQRPERHPKKMPWVTPNIEAQHSGRLDAIRDKIICRRIEVVDEAGKTAVVLTAEDNENHVIVYNKTGNRAVQLGTNEDGTGVIVYNKAGTPAVQLGTNEDENGVHVLDKAGNDAIQLGSGEDENNVIVFGKVGQEKVEMVSHIDHGQHVGIVDIVSNFEWKAPLDPDVRTEQPNRKPLPKPRQVEVAWKPELVKRYLLEHNYQIEKVKAGDVYVITQAATPDDHHPMYLELPATNSGFEVAPYGDMHFEVIKGVLYIGVYGVGKGGFTVDESGNLRVVDSSP